MTRHKGNMVANAVRKSGFSISKISKRLGVSRGTLYNRFQDAELSDAFIRKVDYIIHHQFSNDFLNEIVQGDVSNPASPASIHPYTDVAKKYIELLEHYKDLLVLLARVLMIKKKKH